MTALAWWCVFCAALPALLLFRNLQHYRSPKASSTSREAVSVLIPARNEEVNIGAALESALRNVDVELEVVVLDDHSSDQTAAIVRDLQQRDSRVRLEFAPPLPAGWCGKQHACWLLAEKARNPVLLFVDADVRLSPDAVERLLGFLQDSGADLISGVPRQITRTPLEALLIPLIHFVLLGFLPISRMRADRSPALGAGCGQLFVARRDAYFQVGGHRAIRESMHDGIRLPRAFREAGCMTDLCDLTEIATCRMYQSAREVWFGLAKNATEGLASGRLIGPVTLLLGSGHVLPTLLLAANARNLPAWLALFLSIAPRLMAAVRFRQPWWAAMLHPVSVAVFLVIQWYAFVRERVGVRSSWKGRTVETAA